MIMIKFLQAGKKRAIADSRPDKVSLYNYLLKLGDQTDCSVAFDDDDYKRFIFKKNSKKFMIIITDYINFMTGGFKCVS